MNSEVKHFTPAEDFIVRARHALDDDNLQEALATAGSGFVAKRLAAVAKVPNFEAMRDRAQAVRQKVLKNLDVYLLHFEKKVEEAGGQVHWADSPEQMREIVVSLCKQQGARRVVKGKSMVGEEVHLNDALEAAGMEPLETDLGEYILQLAHEAPSHIVAPALHKTKAQVQDLFLKNHDLGERDISAIEAIVNEARQVIRERFLTSEIGITGANMLIAETGTVAVVTNEGNGDLTATMPATHIVTTSIDKVVPTWEDASAILRVLARSATGQAITSYTSFFTGPRNAPDQDGPEAFHVVLLDNGRSELLGSEYQEMLQCIRCGACMNHCPVYQAVGGHTYNSVYPGPMGAVLTPLLMHRQGDYQLPNASTFCGRCEAVCPVRIPLPGLMRKLRNQEQLESRSTTLAKFLTRSFCKLADHPRLYAALTNLGIRITSLVAGRRGSLAKVPFMSGWTNFRNLPAPQGSSFQAQWAKQTRKDKS